MPNVADFPDLAGSGCSRRFLLGGAQCMWESLEQSYLLSNYIWVAILVSLLTHEQTFTKIICMVRRTGFLGTEWHAWVRFGKVEGARGPESVQIVDFFNSFTQL